MDTLFFNRKQIFEVTSWNDEHNTPIVNANFEWGDDVNCNVQQKTDVMRSMTDYMTSMSDAFSFSESKSQQSDKNVPVIPFLVNYKEKKSKKSSTSTSSDYKNQKKFFESVNGEAYINKAQCIVYKVSINPFSRPVFTDGFKSALRSLQRAANAKNLDAEGSAKIRIEFLKQYGTHYQSECYLGASMTTITRMSSRSTSEAESNRRKECVSNAYSEGTSKGVEFNEFEVEVQGGKPGMSGSVGTTVGGWGAGSSNAYKTASSQCDTNAEADSAFASSGVEQTEIISVGVSPYTAKEKWVEAIRKAPSSMKFVLTDITKLLTRNNINHIPLDELDPDGKKLDAASIKRFLRFTIERYCNITLKEPCPPPESCSIWNNCTVGQRCVDDSSAENGFHCEDFRQGIFRSNANRISSV